MKVKQLDFDKAKYDAVKAAMDWAPLQLLNQENNNQ